MSDPELIWSNILSRNAADIVTTWNSLSNEEQTAVRAHLSRMVSEDGWAEPQRVSAQVALDTLQAHDQENPSGSESNH